MNALKRLLHYIDIANTKVGLVTSLLFLIIGGVTITEVVARYFFRSPTIFAWDINMETFAVLVILSGGYVLLHDRHTRIDIAIVSLPIKVQLLFDMVALLVITAVAFIITWQGAIAGWDSFLSKETLYSMWSPPVWQIKLLLPIGGLLLMLQAIAKLLRDAFAFTGREI